MEKPQKGGLIGRMMAVLKDIGDLNVAAHAAGACYFLTLSVFPTMVLLLGLIRYTFLGVSELMEILDGLVPAALLPYVHRLAKNTYDNSTTVMLSGSAVVALWSASRGVYGLQRGLNAMYRVKETRNLLRVRLGSMLYTFLLLIVLILTLVLHVFGTTILSYLPEINNPILLVITDIVDFRFFLLLFVQTLFFALMYAKLPNGKRSFRSGLPGALLASSGWLIYSDIFSMYVEFFPYYPSLFGSVYAVALAMLWLYCCISIVFYGGALNRWLSEKK